MRMAPTAMCNMAGGVMLAMLVVACQPDGADSAAPGISRDLAAYQDLMLRSDADAEANAGRCVPDSSPFGCHAKLENGEATGFLCVD